jgi:hypothetical protein
VAHIDVVVGRIEVGQAVGEVEAHIEEGEVGLVEEEVQAEEFGDVGVGGRVLGMVVRSRPSVALSGSLLQQVP